MRIALENHGQQLAKRIQWANLMFTAYQHDLSARGRELALVTSRAAERIALEQYDAPEVHRVTEEVLSHWPDPLGTNLLDSQEASWLNWFTVNEPEKSLLDPIGEGCLEPCSFCERGNISGWAHDDPLYIVAARIKRAFESVKSAKRTLLFQGIFANNAIEWLDPFFHFDIASLAASLATLDCKTFLFLLIKAFEANDLRILNVARRLNNIQGPHYQSALMLSFHLGISSPGFDIIQAIAGAGGAGISSEIIERYAQRYATNFTALSSILRKVFMYGIGFGIRQGKLWENPLVNRNDASQVFNWATRQTFVRALNLAKLDIKNLPFIIDPLDRRPLLPRGRGSDFLSRLDKAFYQGKDLAADPSLGRDLVQGPNPYTRVARKSDGTIIVVNPRQPEEILVQTTLDKLWPIATA